MVTIVVVINTLIAMMLLYVAWRVRLLRRRLKRIADTLIAAERSTHAVLHPAPNAIYRGQQGIHKLRQGKEPLQLKIQRVRQVLSLLGLGQQLWRRFFVVERSQFLKQRFAKYR